MKRDGKGLPLLSLYKILIFFPLDFPAGIWIRDKTFNSRSQVFPSTFLIPFPFLDPKTNIIKLYRNFLELSVKWNVEKLDKFVKG